MSKRKSCLVKEKLAVVARIKNGESKSSIKKQCGIPGGTLRGWLDDGAKLLSFVNRVEDEVGLGRKRTTLDECQYIWYLQKCNEGALLSPAALKQQADKLQEELDGNKPFKASNGWLWRWQRRHGVTRDFMLGAARPLEYEGAETFLSHVEREISGGDYCEQQVYSCGQATLCYKMLPSNGRMQSSERSSDHKLKPRCFKNINLNSLPMIYASSNNIVIFHSTFEAWFHEQRLHLLSRNLEPKALLLLDDHHDVPGWQDTSCISPRNRMSHLPLEQGIIRAFKKNYRRELLLALMSSNKDATSFLKSLTLKISLAWGSIPAETVIHCWGKCFGECKQDGHKVEGNGKLQVDSVHEWIKMEDEVPNNYIEDENFEGFSSKVVCAQDWMLKNKNKVLVSSRNDSESEDVPTMLSSVWMW